MAEDVVAAVVEDLTARLLSARSGDAEKVSSFPFSIEEVFRGEEPARAVAEAFRAVVWRGLQLRSTDELRRHYVRVKLSDRLAQAEVGARESADLDVLRYLAALANRIESLSPAQRELLVESGGATMSNSDRQRLFRLRRQLARDVQRDLGLMPGGSDE